MKNPITVRRPSEREGSFVDSAVPRIHAAPHAGGQGAAAAEQCPPPSSLFGIVSAACGPSLASLSPSDGVSEGSGGHHQHQHCHQRSSASYLAWLLVRRASSCHSPGGQARLIVAGAAPLLLAGSDADGLGGELRRVKRAERARRLFGSFLAASVRHPPCPARTCVCV